MKRIISLILCFTFLFSLTITAFAINPPPGEKVEKPKSYNSVNEINTTLDIIDETISSSKKDENAVLINGGELSMGNTTIRRTSNETGNASQSSFYGVGAAVLATKGIAYINNTRITTNAEGGAGVFSYKDGVIYIADSTINTKLDASGAIHVAGDGKLYAWNLTASTAGASSAAIRSDKGGGTMIVNGGTYTTSGIGSPAIYSTANIFVNKATLTAKNSEGICIEGKNSVNLYGCNLTSNMREDDQNNGLSWTVILYQSNSGDAKAGTTSFTMKDGSIDSQNGGLFYTTNTTSNIYLENVDITQERGDWVLRATTNYNVRGWGKAGANGANCTFTGVNQVLVGDVVWDSFSNLDFRLLNGSSWTGAFLDDEEPIGENPGKGMANITISKDSTWVVTADATITNLTSAGNIVDSDGELVTIKDKDENILVEGTSPLTLTVSNYSTEVPEIDITIQDWENIKIDKPAGLTEAKKSVNYYLFYIIAGIAVIIIISCGAIIFFKKK